MNTMKNVAKNAGIQYFSRIIGTIFGLITLSLLTRYLGDEGYGRYTVAVSYLQFIGTLIDFGLNITATAVLGAPGADEKKIMGNLFTLRLVSAVIFFGGACALSFLFPWGGQIQLAIWAGSLSFIFLSLHQVLLGLFQKHLRLVYPAVAEAIGRAVLLGAVAWVILRGGGLVPIMLALGAANLIMVGLTLIFAEKLVRFAFRFDLAIVRAIIKRSWPIAVSIVFNLIYLRGDIMVMKLVGRPDAEIGWYGAAYKPLDVITVIPIILMGLVLPLFVNAWQSADRARIENIIRRSVDAVSLLAFPVLAGGLVLATPLMIFISGSDFAPSGPLLALLLVAAFMVFYGALFGHLIVGINRQRTMMFVYAADAIVSLALYLIFIPRYGAIAAALVTIFSEAVIAVSAGIIVVRETKTKIIFYTAGKAFLAAGSMAIAVNAIDGMNVLLRILIGAVIYFLLLIILRAFKKDEIALLAKSA